MFRLLSPLVVAALFSSGMIASASADDSQPLRIAIAGDSTARDYTNMSGSYANLRGWGQYLEENLSASHGSQILNHGKGGCSSKSFINEGRWDKLLADQPDIVLIQFGHNDIPNKGLERETLFEEMPETLPAEGLGSNEMDWYRHNMRTYIQTARDAGVTPVIVTPMERRAFKSNGKDVREKNKPWADAAKAVAQEMDVLVVDMNVYSIDLLNGLGFDACEFMHPLKDGELDNTHYNETGARIYAEYIAKTLGQLLPEVTPLVSLPETATADQDHTATTE